MGRNAEALLEHISEIVVRNQHNCIASAVAVTRIDIQNADVIQLRGVRIESEAEKEVEDCSAQNDVMVGSMHKDLEDRLDQVVQASPDRKKEMKVALQEALTVETVSTCAAIALASTEINIQDVEGTVRLENVKMQQLARASIKSCLSNVKVRIGEADMTLNEYLRSLEADMTVDALADGKAKDMLKVSRVPCVMPEDARAKVRRAWLRSGIGLAILVVVLAVLAWLL